MDKNTENAILQELKKIHEDINSLKNNHINHLEEDVKGFSNKFDNITNKIDNINTNVNSKIDNVNTNINTKEANLNNRLDNTNNTIHDDFKWTVGLILTSSISIIILILSKH